ncbi:MAG: NAD(P)H-quinone oxidoreductase subunit 4, partial [Cyanobacteria bacterium J06629_9]
IVILAAVGVVMSPIYLLSMLRRVFYGTPGEIELPQGSVWSIRPRESFIALCLLVPIIGIGLYPKLATQTYDIKSSEVANRVQNIRLADGSSTVPFFAQVFETPQLAARPVGVAVE